ncbi:hypothetical protein [Geodermatophilus sp. DSM 45219]|uniref:hypothetical protein n=1 Tax=Geodermatophilus sp. DSM 45219 TaxID=1881103 RepID=UPI000887E6A6|nr:hypothetical protein [Geodermatophilus sp. DSM 45219]SDN53317.1 hypothetical protein SAMN05428965_0816 [Geodermatophilus sp. DSM 45219]
MNWWLLAAPVVPLLASMALPFAPLTHAAFALLGAVPAVVVGRLLIRRHRAEAAVA